MLIFIFVIFMDSVELSKVCALEGVLFGPFLQ